jgi:hypothetical protein
MVIEDVDIESMVTARPAGTEDMEPEEYEACVKTQIAKAMAVPIPTLVTCNSIFPAEVLL